MTVNGTTTTLDTNLQEVDLINVQANGSTPAIGVTQSGSGAIIAAYDGASEVFRVDDGGNVGIGTDSADTILHINPAADCYVTLEPKTTDGNAGLIIKNSVGTQKGYVIYDTDDNYLRLGSDNSERLRITSGGNVNIGGNYTQTTYTSQITGTLNVTGNITQNGATVTTTGKAIAMAMVFG